MGGILRSGPETAGGTAPLAAVGLSISGIGASSTGMAGGLAACAPPCAPPFVALGLSVILGVTAGFTAPLGGLKPGISSASGLSGLSFPPSMGETGSPSLPSSATGSIGANRSLSGMGGAAAACAALSAAKPLAGGQHRMETEHSNTQPNRATSGRFGWPAFLAHRFPAISINCCHLILQLNMDFILK